MGPQLYRCGNLTCAANTIWPCHSLQWGCNFIVAEISCPGFRGIHPDQRFNGAATLSLRKCCRTIQTPVGLYPLQWGRNFIVAEILHTTRQDTACRGRFNGAATLSLRKCCRTIQTPVGLYPLQWGRNFIVAEILHTTRQDTACRGRFNGAATLSLRKSVVGIWAYLCAFRASMGPQLYRCGNQSLAFGLTCVHSGLQWGRNFIVAEIKHKPDHVPGRKDASNGAATLSLRKYVHVAGDLYLGISLQWGRNFIVAEMCRGRPTTCVKQQASMGPQLYRCGNADPPAK